MRYALNSRWTGNVLDYTLTLPEGTVRGRIQAPEGEEGGTIRLADLARQFLAACDSYCGEAIRHFREGGGGEVSCLMGCAACCRQLVTVSPPEAFLLLDWIDALPVDRRDLVVARFDAAARRLDPDGLLHRLRAINDRALTPDNHFALARDYFLLGLACPFLDEERCDVYPIRPAACRTYFVASPAAWCGDPFSKAICPIPVSLPARDALACLAADVLRSDCLDLVPLPLLTSWGKAHEADRRRAWGVRSLAGRFMSYLEYAIQSME